MKSHLLLSAILCLSLLSCQEKNPLRKAPDCIQAYGPQSDANNLVVDPSLPKGVIKVYEYSHLGKKYYELILGCCDQFSEMYDENCEIVCYPRGGHSGGGAGDCPDWVDIDKGELVWEKE